MPERTSYANGVPSWVDLTTPDVDASTAFYGGLLGWEHALAPGDPAMTGGYGMFSLGDKVVAGVGPLRNETQPAVWNSYVAVDDADATVAAATEAGGAVVMPVIDVGDAGRLAYLADPAAAVFGIWQAGQRAGVELVNEPGAYCWNELAVRDAAAATPFYASIFGWDAEPMEGSPMGYITFVRDGAMIAGCMPMDDGWPAEVPSHWMVYFAVADTDASAKQATELGGSLRVEPFDAPGVGRMAVIADPHGTTFSIIALANPGS